MHSGMRHASLFPAHPSSISTVNLCNLLSRARKNKESPSVSQIECYKMSRGGSFGGGRSSLGYLFESDVPPISPSGSTEATKSPKPSSDEGSKNKATVQETPPEKSITNNYHRAQGQNSGNFITGRPSTKVQSAPGGSSSLGYLFGDK